MTTATEKSDVKKLYVSAAKAKPINANWPAANVSGRFHPDNIAASRPDERRDGLRQRQHQRQNDSE
ncbi:MAG: hypothetical protein R3C40_04515 [Parvularculaceae bacterium]